MNPRYPCIVNHGLISSINNRVDTIRLSPAIYDIAQYSRQTETNTDVDCVRTFCKSGTILPCHCTAKLRQILLRNHTLSCISCAHCVKRFVYVHKNIGYSFIYRPIKLYNIQYKTQVRNFT